MISAFSFASLCFVILGVSIHGGVTGAAAVGGRAHACTSRHRSHRFQTAWHNDHAKGCKRRRSSGTHCPTPTPRGAKKHFHGIYKLSNATPFCRRFPPCRCSCTHEAANPLGLADVVVDIRTAAVAETAEVRGPVGAAGAAESGSANRTSRSWLTSRARRRYGSACDGE